jgi:hypothetical protein
MQEIHPFRNAIAEDNDYYIHGVEIALNRWMKGILLEWSAVSERLITARLSGTNPNLGIIQQGFRKDFRIKSSHLQ